MQDLFIRYNFDSIKYEIEDFNEKLQAWLVETNKQGAVDYEIGNGFMIASDKMQSVEIKLLDDYQIVIVINNEIRRLDDIVITAYVWDDDCNSVELSELFIREDW